MPTRKWVCDGTSEDAAGLEVWPLDEHNAALLDSVHPLAWDAEPSGDMIPCYDLIAVGAGAGGLVSAKQSARRGARSAMISEHLAGGDCLNVGCVPSKALLRCARMARELKASESLLAGGTAPQLDFGAVMERMRRLRAKIGLVDSHEVTVAAGADVFQGRGRFVGPNELEVNGKRLRFRKAVVATGGRAVVPSDVRGLERAPYLTNATLFNLTALPPRMVVLGSGAVGLEMAQAFASFGSQVTVLVRGSRVLSHEHEATSAAARAALEAAGVTFVCGAKLEAVSILRDAARGSAELPLLELVGSSDAGLFSQQCEALLVAVGRAANVADLGLEAANVAYTADGVTVNARCQSVSNADIFAVGDCVAGVPRLTHMSGEMAKVAVQNALFGGEWELDYTLVPRCVYTEPEVAAVGLATAADAARAGLEVEAYSCAMEHNDRAILEGEQDDGGFVTLLVQEGTDRIVGGTVVGSRAGEIINEVTVAMSAGLGLEKLARVIHPYPTTGEAVMQAALGYIRKHWARMPSLSSTFF